VSILIPIERALGSHSVTYWKLLTLLAPYIPVVYGGDVRRPTMRSSSDSQCML